jgi:RHS repeat-associated protein
MPGRGWNTGRYRYGFNGKENDNEVKGEGNQQDYGFRIYDPRIGKFLSVDPLSAEFPWNSTYAFAENDVIRCIDLEGAEKYVKTYSYKISGGKTVLNVTDNVWKQQTAISINPVGRPETDKQIAAYNAITYQRIPKPGNGSFAFFEFSPELGKANYGKYTYTDGDGKQQVQYFSNEELQFRFDEIETARQKINKDLNIAVAGANLVGAGMLAKAELKGASAEMKTLQGTTSTGAALANTESSSFTRVGRWMEQRELNIMKKTGRVAEGGGGQTFVSINGYTDYMPTAAKGTVYVEFDVPTNSLVSGGKVGWFKTLGPSAGRSQMNELNKLGGELQPEFKNLSEVLHTKTK